MHPTPRAAIGIAIALAHALAHGRERARNRDRSAACNHADLRALHRDGRGSAQLRSGK